jgi:AraC-like DNA-binding protein
MQLSTVINLLLIIGAVQGFIFIAVTFFLRKRIEKPVLFLNLFVLFLSLNNLQSWVLESNISEDALTTFFTVPWYLMIVPMFYSFLVHYLEIEKKKNPLIGISIGLFLIAIALRYWLVMGVKKGTIALKTLETYSLFEDGFALVYSIVLFILCIDVVKRQQKLYADILVFDNLRWISRFLRLGGIVFILWSIAVVLNIFSETIKAPESYYPLRLVSSILIYWVAYQAFFNYRLLKDRVKLRKLIKKDSSIVSANKKETPSKTKFTFEQFENHIADKQSYLNPNLSLETLAEELKIGVSTLSKVVNENGSGFSEYINAARVREAQRILTDLDFKNYTIVAIGLECGFNSKSTFYNSFKKVTQESPTDFRKRMLE